MRTALLLTVLLVAGATTANFGFQRVKAVTIQAAPSPVDFTIIANIEGWNASVPGCPSGTANCNPTITEFRGVSFLVLAKWGDCCTHDFSIYTKGTPPAGVDSTSACFTTNTNGCLARTPSITPTSSWGTSFNATVPKDDFTGLGIYEYYCEFHPLSMHGKFTIYKNPDLVKAGTVNIVDVATVAFSFGTTPTSLKWNIAADLDNNGVVDILDVAFAAFYFGQPI